MSADPEAVVIGSGPNGLVAAAHLARAGLKVLVLEAHPTRAGGAVAHDAGTLPGFVHDVGAGFFPFGRVSPAFRSLDLEGAGLGWRFADLQSSHPAPDGSVASIARDDDRTAAAFGPDGEAWRRLVRAHRRVEARLLEALLGPVPTLAPVLRLGPLGLARLGALGLSTARGFSGRRFRSEAARRVLPALGLHVDLGPDDAFGAAVGYLLGMLAATQGNAVPRGGAGAVTAALLRRLEEAGGSVRLGARVDRIRVHEGRARAVRLSDGTEIPVGRAVLADTDAAGLYLDLLAGARLPERANRRMRAFPRGWGTFKVDWALSGPVPWRSEDARGSAVVHTGDSVDDLARFTRQVRAGELPDNPYLVVGQQSLADPGRAPPGQHTLWAYSRVPSTLPGGWAAAAESFADRIDTRLEGLAPGFRALVRARRVLAPPDLEAMDANLVGGDLGGGSSAWRNLLFLRPVFPWFRYATPVRGVYLCSSSAHPGAGVHGMCGFNAARRVLRSLGG